MASARVKHSGPCTLHFWPRVIFERRRWFVLVEAVLLASLACAQGNPRVTGVEPASGKMNDNVTVTGENLGKSNVSAVFLSDDKTDYKATVVEQSDGKIVMKVPQVKAGDYKVSLQAGNNIYIQPVRFTVQN
jgi:IPT/TIG domain